MRIQSFSVLFAAGAAIFAVSHANATPADDLAAIFKDYQQNEMEENPFEATYAGVHDYNDQVPSQSPSDAARRLAEADAFLGRLNAVDRAQLSEADGLNADLLTYIIKQKIALAPFAAYRAPFLADSGFHTLGYLVGATRFRNGADYEAYLARLEALPGYIEQNIDNMRDGLAVGFAQPKAIMPGALKSFDGQVVEDVVDHPLYRPFTAMPTTISKREQRAIRRRGEEILTAEVLPAYAALADFMRNEYAPNARDELGISTTPDGEAYYAALVRYFTTLDDATPDAIHKLGLREVKRIRAEMMDVIEETGFDGDFAQFLEFLRTDRQFYAETPQEMLERAAWIAKDIDGRLPAYFGRLTRQPYSVEPVPNELAPNYTNARYVGAPLDGARGGQFWVNTYKIGIRPMYQLVAMALHEAVPGHHLQIALSKEIQNAPDFRKGYYPHAYGEGWALYAEKLGVEMGVYNTPYDHFGRLTWEMWRACRLVIDTGIHAKGWSRQEAIDYLAGNTALSLHNVETEIDRYIAWPGQALAYKMGELTIWELRAKAEAALGDDFDIREFHDVILADGGVPLEMLRARIDQYIAVKTSGEDRR